MVRVITDTQQIKKLHKKFHSQLSQFITKETYCRVGRPNGSFMGTVAYSSSLNIWVCVQQQNTKYWNGFGIGEPKSGSNSINGEINFDYEGSRRITGVFAIDDNNKILVLHSGNIGGGRKGVGKKMFLSNFRGDPVMAIHGDREIEYCLVGELNSSHFHDQIATFIGEIFRVKNLNPTKIAAEYGNLSDFNYTDERFGRSVTERHDPRIIVRTHGIVVNALATELENRQLRVANDRSRDLFIHDQSHISTLFEIKTSSSTHCLYQAVGQLLLYSIPIRNAVKMVAVLPDRLNMKVARRFNSLGIHILYYRWENNAPVFIDLDELLKKTH